MGKRIAVVGVGALGGYVGGNLAHAGEDVTLIDFWPENIETIRKRGLELDGVTPEEKFTVTNAKTMHLTEMEALSRQKPIDIAFVSMKSYDTEWATALIKQYLAPDGYVVSLQNCLNEERIAGVVGWGKTVGMVASLISVDMFEPGPHPPHRRQGRRQAHRVPGRRGPWPHHQARRGAARDGGPHRQRQDHHQPVGRALVQALPERHEERRLGGHRPHRRRLRPQRRHPPLLDQARRRGGAGRPGAGLPHREDRQDGARDARPRRRRATRRRSTRSRPSCGPAPTPIPTRAPTSSARRWPRTSARAAAPRSSS